jgi:hypothetical protein
VGESEHAAAWKTAISAALPGPASAYEFGDPEVAESVPTSALPNVYVLISLSRSPSAAARLTGATRDSGWRLTTRAVGRTLDQARWARAATYTAVQFKRLPGFNSSPARLESEERIVPGGGMFWGDTDWLYAAVD